jgi:hypothetical protein
VQLTAVESWYNNPTTYIGYSWLCLALPKRVCNSVSLQTYLATPLLFDGKRNCLNMLHTVHSRLVAGKHWATL